MHNLYVSISQEHEYRGQHQAPGPDDGAPLHDLTANEIYPQDVYSDKGLQYYGDGSSHCRNSMAVILVCRNKPRAEVKIYRAVPKILTKEEKIAAIIKAKAAFLKTGRVPKDSRYSKENYYDRLCTELERLEQLPAQAVSKITINAGDWVTITKSYAVEHGHANLRDGFKVISKSVTASQLFTNGDSLNEWGYWP